MPTLFTDPVNITPGTAATWVDADVSAHCPAGTTGVVLEFVNNSTAKSVGWRKKGSTDDRPGLMPGDAHMFAFCGVDNSRVLQLWVQSNTAATVFLHGYFGSEAYFFTNAPEITTGVVDAWKDVDISSHIVSGDSAVAAFVEYRNTVAVLFGLRPNGSSDDYKAACAVGGRGGVAAVDSNYIFESYVGNAVTQSKLYLNGYLKYSAVMDASESDVTPDAGGAWVDLAALPAGAVGGIYRMYGSQSGINDVSAVRCKGSTIKTSAAEGDCNRHIWGIVKCDANRILEGYVNPIVGRSGDNRASTPIALDSAVGAVLSALGGTADKWGLSLTPALVKASSFGVAIGFIATADDAKVYVDYVTLKITYTSGGVQSVTDVKFPTIANDYNSTPWNFTLFISTPNVCADDTSYAYVTSSLFDTGRRPYAIYATAFDFSAIPDDATIDGVECVVSAWYRGGTVSLDLCQLIDVTPASGTSGKIYRIGYVTEPPTPTITGLSKNSGAVGDSITITGTGFFRAQMSGIVEFNGTEATITSWSDTSIVCTVPEEATSGNIVVTNDYGNASAGTAFTVTVPPQEITATGIASALAIGSPTVTPGAVTIAATAIASAIAIGEPAVSQGAVDQTITATAIASAASIGQPTVTPGAVSIAATGIASAASIGQPSVTPGTATIGATGIASAASVGEPTVTTGAVSVSATGIASAATVGEPAVTVGAATIRATGIPSAATIGQPAITTGAVTITAAAIASAATIGAPAVAYSVQPTGIGSAALIGQPSVLVGGVTCAAVGIASALVFGLPEVDYAPGTPRLTFKATARQTTIDAPERPITIDAPARAKTIRVGGD